MSSVFPGRLSTASLQAQPEIVVCVEAELVVYGRSRYGDALEFELIRETVVDPPSLMFKAKSQ